MTGADLHPKDHSIQLFTDASNHFSTPRQNPSNVMTGADLHPKDHSIQLFTDASNEGWGAHLDQSSTKGLWSDRKKGYT